MIKALEDHAYSLAGETVEDHKRKCRKIYPANGIIYQKQGQRQEISNLRNLCINTHFYRKKVINVY